MRRLLKRLFKIFLYLILVLLILANGVVILARIYDQEIKQYAISYLNQYLVTDVHVDNVHLDLFKRFPQATLVFENAHIEDINDEAKGDTMLFARELLLKFNFRELFEGNYNVTHVEVLDAHLNLSVNKNGQENYLIWEQQEKPGTKEFKFELQEVVCKNTRIIYRNDLTHQLYDGTTNQVLLSGAFTQSSFDLNIQSNLLVNNVSINELTYLKNEQSSVHTILNIDKTARKYTINSGHAEISGLPFDVSGYYQADSSWCDLAIAGKHLELHQVFTVFPDVFFEKFEAYKSNGVLDFDATIFGQATKEFIPAVNASFHIHDGSMVETETGMQLSDLDFKGTFTNEDFGELNIEKLSGKLLNSSFHGTLNVSNFHTPDVILDVAGNLDLKSVQDFFRFETINYLNGSVNFDTYLKGRSVNGSFKTRKSSGSFKAEGVNMKTQVNGLEYSNLNGEFRLRNGHAYISSFTGNIFDSDFNLAGVLRDFIPYILSNNATLTIEADLDSKYTDLSQIIRMAASAGESRPGAPESILPENLAFNLNTTIETLIYGKLDVSNLRGVAQLENQILRCHKLRGNANEGTYLVNFEFDGSSPNNYLLTSDTRMRKIDIHNFFSEFDNFGQTFLQDRHVKGIANVDAQFACALDNGFKIKPFTILSTVDLDISKGELIGLDVLQEITQYLESNHLIKPFVNTELMSEKLRHITFSDLSNRIEIKNEKIHIPKMEIGSSAMDINIKGTHWFNDSIDYGFNFRLKDVLMRDTKPNEFGHVIDDGSGYRIFLSMTGTVDNPVFGLDREEKKQARQERVAEEKATMKSILKQELGLYGKDSSVHEYREPEQRKVQFEFDWDDEDTTTVPVEAQFEKKKREKRRNGLNTLFQKWESGLGGTQKADSVGIEVDGNF